MKEELTEIRNQLYDSIPLGEMNAEYTFSLILCINDHLKKLDTFIDKIEIKKPLI